MNFQHKPFTTEFQLMVECCRWSFAHENPQPILELAHSPHWDRFLSLSRRHRVQGLIWHSLSKLEISIPPEIAAPLSEEAMAVAEHNLRAAQQSKLLLDAFAGAGIPLLFIKGLTLGKLAYGDPFLKMGWDIDVLAPLDAIESVIVELERLNYRLAVPPIKPQSPGFRQWHERRKESVWRSSDGPWLELHTRLADSLRLIPGIGLASARQNVLVAPNILLPTLAREELVAYLCVHGAASAWFRLKWITDLAALLHECTPEEVDRLYARSQELGAARAASQALILASRIYGTAVSPALAGKLQSHASNRWLANTAWDQMMREGEPTETPFGTVPIHLAQLFLGSGIQFKIEEAARQVSEWAGRIR